MAQHQYPGINVDLKYPGNLVRRDTDPPSYDAWGEYDEHMLQIREVFMMVLMEALTDKPEWQRKVFDEDIVAKWRQEAQEQSERGLFDLIVHKTRSNHYPAEDEEEEDDEWWVQEFGPKHERYTQRSGYTRTHSIPFPRCRILSEECFEFCIRELRTKAAYHDETKLIPTLDSSGRAVVKSDFLVGTDLKDRLRGIFAELRAEQVAKGLDWHPRTDEKVLDLGHPSLYPFVYGRSPFIQEEVVGASDAITAWAGKGTISPADATLATPAGTSRYWRTNIGEGNNWSAKYQWLPANVDLKDGKPRFTSYINNLHPEKYAHVYHAIEDLIDLAIPAWNQVLTPCGRQEPRFSVPNEADDRETEGLWQEMDAALVAECPLRPTDQDLNDMKWHFDWPEKKPGALKKEDFERIRAECGDDIDSWKWEQIRDAIFPEPDGDAEQDYIPKDNLRDRFKDRGLQVYVKMARIELTPEKPEFPAGGWHVEGMINERICATALYYLDSENITTSALDFRMNTDRDQEDLSMAAGQDAYNWLERVYGVDLRGDRNLQYYGRVETREGRLLAFPNCLQHRVSPFKLDDPTKPGHRSFIALWLVDPGQRVVSTANVPPQQLDWWVEAVFGNANANLGTMPPEIVSLLLENPELAERLPSGAKEHAQKTLVPDELYAMLRELAGSVTSGLMSLAEAKEHRLNLMDERTVYAEATDSGQNVETYSFCEH